MPGSGGLKLTSPSAQVLAGASIHALGLRYWFHAPADGGPYTVAVLFTGRRLNVAGERGAADDFRVTTSMRGVTAGSGRVALTRKVLVRADGEWHVRADAVALPPCGSGSPALVLPSCEAMCAARPEPDRPAPGARPALDDAMHDSRS